MYGMSVPELIFVAFLPPQGWLLLGTRQGSAGQASLGTAIGKAWLVGSAAGGFVGCFGWLCGTG